MVTYDTAEPLSKKGAVLEAFGRRRSESLPSRALPSIRGPAKEQDAAISRHNGPPDDFPWKQPSARPLDMDGPTSYPFRRMGDDFSEKPAFWHLERVVEKYRDKIAISDGSTSLTFSELLNAVQNLAGAIADSVPAGKAVGLLIGNTLWYPVAMLAAMRAGRPAVPLNPRDPFQRLAAIATSARLAAIVKPGPGKPVGWPDASSLKWIDAASCLAQTPGGGLPVLPSDVSVDSPAIVLYTSGSTGTPKGVVNSQRAILQRVQQYVDACHIGSDDVFMPLTGPATIAGCREMMTPMLCGATLYLSDIESAGIRAARDNFQKWRVTVVYLVPALVRVLMSGSAPDTFSSLRVVRVGGEKILWSDIDRLRDNVPGSCFVQISYSSTETTGTQWILPWDYPERGATVPVGFVLPGIEYTVVDENGCEVAPGDEGELLIRGNYTTLGYWADGGNVPLQASSANPRLRIFATGDLVKVDDTGMMWIVGRKGRQIKINGRRVEPAELELVLRRAPQVKDAVAVVTDANELVAFVVPAKTDGSELVPELRELIRRTLPPAVHPTRLHSVAEIPQLKGGKVDGVRLRELDCALNAQDAQKTSAVRQAANPLDVEGAATAVWERILPGKKAAGSHWDDAGGDSLKLLQFVMELETALGRELNLDAFTVGMSFADIVRAASPEQDTSSSLVEASDPRPILFIVPGSIGYGPSLAAFGVEMSNVARVVAARYGDLNDLLKGHGTIPRMVDAIVDQISEVQPDGNVNLIGYSLGGGVAFEVAAKLVAAGRSVTFLGILDTNIGAGQHNYRETLARTAQRIRAHRVTVDRMILRALAKIFARLGAEALLARGIDRLKWRAFARTRFILRLELEEILRMRAFGQWLVQPKTALPITATLFRCRRTGVPSDLGWGAFFAGLNIVPIVGGHLDMLIEPHLSHNRPLIEGAFLVSGS
ncbi:AMP-binding protein [Mesorhizobium sp. AR07]|uniref:AMP-binding protein n=1 Tax=Mesorhizobium sp. AR07 TaxID=2865838 RepID=UPI002161031E|nr:AMP-binding protein [Mesorhizobium sp. AR07]UVK44018.1 AMP-binding protein [Mesorhizobium sp. AR07]